MGSILRTKIKQTKTTHKVNFPQWQSKVAGECAEKMHTHRTSANTTAAPDKLSAHPNKQLRAIFTGTNTYHRTTHPTHLHPKVSTARYVFSV